MNSLSVSQLVSYGFCAEVVAALQRDGVQDLLPLQQQALRRPEFLAGDNLLLLAPTSAGKTLVGELAALRHWQAGRKAVFLAPTKALAEEQFRHLRRRYGPLGLRVMLSTADHTRQDGRIARGEFDLAVMVYEKCRAFLISSPGLICSLGVVIADEVQVLHDAERGAAADRLLSRLAQAESHVQIVALSAVLDRAGTVAEWLEADMLHSTARPSELREGVFCAQHQCFHYRDRAGQWADETLPGEPLAAVAAEDAARDDGTAQAVALAVALARAGGNSLIFAPTRSQSRQMALAIARELGVDSAVTADDCSALMMAEETAMRAQLWQCVPAGVAFHNSDLTPELRRFVETAFQEGRIQVLVATPTLAQGVNLPASNVIHIPVMMGADGGAAPQGMRRPQVALSVDRYKNQAGRAGRWGAPTAFGRSILVAASHTQAARLARLYVEVEQAEGPGCGADGDLDGYILDFVEGGLAATFSELLAALEKTFIWGGRSDQRAGSNLPVDRALGEAVRRLLEWNLLDESPSHRLRVTELGQTAAAAGLRAETIREMQAFTPSWLDRSPSEMEILLACAFTADGETFPMSATREEIRTRRWMAQVEAVLRQEKAWEGEDMQAILRPPGGLAPHRHNGLKLAAAAHGWISRTDTGDLERALGIAAGTMAAGAAHLAWLAGGLHNCARVAGCADEVLARLAAVALRLPLGLSGAAQELARLQVAGLSRNYLHRLADDGLDTPAAVAGACPQSLRRILPVPLTDALLQEMKTRRGDYSEPAGEPPPASEPAAASDDLAVPAAAAASFTAAGAGFDLILDAEDPGTVVFRGEKVQLSPKPYALLGVLARRCGSTVSYRESMKRCGRTKKWNPSRSARTKAAWCANWRAAAMHTI